MDATIAVVLVLAFFLVFMVILWFSFPKGVGLGNAIRSLAPAEHPGHQPVVDRQGSRWERRVAKLATVDRNVKNKEANSIVWGEATKGLELGEQDAIQTFSDSGATIDFERHQQLTLGENSLVVIRRMERDAVSDARRASVVLLGGEVEGSIGPASGGPSSVEIVAGRAAANITSRAGGATTFRIAAKPNDASSISIVTGAADVSIGGRLVTVRAGQTVSVSPDGAISGPRAIASAPTLLTPDNGAMLRARLLPLSVGFAWKDNAPAGGARIEVARDPSFRPLVFDRHVTGSSLNGPGLVAGRYYWRVRLSDGMTEGRTAPARSFEVRSDVDPPSLHVGFPEGPLDPGPVTIRGTTEPGALVYIGRKECPVGPDGAFEGSVLLRPGAQVVIVEAVDAVGNFAYASRTLAAR